MNKQTYCLSISSLLSEIKKSVVFNLCLDFEKNVYRVNLDIRNFIKKKWNLQWILNLNNWLKS